MITVVDTCAVSSMLNPSDQYHQDFKPVLDLLNQGRIKMVYGGKKFKQELAKMSSYMRLLQQLKVAGKVIELQEDVVDVEQAKVEAIENNKDFDDPHLIATIIVSRAGIICTRDDRAIPFIKDNKFYKAANLKKPRIYTKAKNSNLFNYC